MPESKNMFFKELENLNLGYDSDLKLVQVEHQKYIIKTYKGERSITNRNKELLYHEKLNKLGFPNFKFHYLDRLAPNQLCMEFIEDMEILYSVEDTEKVTELAKFMRLLLEKSESPNNIFVYDDKIEIVEYDAYWEWMKKDILKRKAEPKLTDLGLKIIDNFQIKKMPLTLLHSDFHGGNIAFEPEGMLLFDAGDVPFLYGHKYHDLSRFICYYPEGVIFKDEPIQEKIKPFVSELEDIVFSDEFLKFCFLQTQLVYNNPFLPRIKEIAEYLYLNLQ